MNNIINKAEILAPAGDMERLSAAINYGADAVYLAGKEFGMRASPNNFGEEDLKKADKNTIIILTPEGVRDIRDNYIDPTVIYLYTNLETIKKRLMKRNDTNDKLENRIKRDTKDFEFAEILADKIISNDFNDDINDVVDTIMYFYNLVQ